MYRNINSFRRVVTLGGGSEKNRTREELLGKLVMLFLELGLCKNSSTHF